MGSWGYRLSRFRVRLRGRWWLLRLRVKGESGKPCVSPQHSNTLILAQLLGKGSLPALAEPSPGEPKGRELSVSLWPAVLASS